MYGWQALTAPQYQLAESPFWHPEEQRLYWIDIVGCTICRTEEQMHQVDTWQLPEEPGCIAPVRGGGLVMALRGGIYYAPTWHGSLRRVATLPYDSASVRANDGKCDALGRLWVGTVDASKTGQAALFCVDCTDGSVRITCHASGAHTANGLAWSPDQRLLYWADTPQHCVYQWHYDLPTGATSHRKEWLRWNAKPAGWKSLDPGYAGRPDGATIDSNGDYWVAMYEGGCIEQYTDQGKRVAEHPMPVRCPTMPCFGGADLCTVFVTTARYGRSQLELDAYPYSGAVLHKRMPTPGTPVSYFVWNG